MVFRGSAVPEAEQTSPHLEVVMDRCESWLIKKVEHRRIDAFKLVLEKTLESPFGLQGDQTSQS